MHGVRTRDAAGTGSGGGVGRDARALLAAALPALAALVVLRALVVGLYRVPSPSMSPTIGVGDCVLGERVSVVARPPRPGEVVTFRSPEDPGTTLVKRVVAVGGQVVDVRDGAVLVNGRRICEPYARGGTVPATAAEGASVPGYPHLVPEGHAFLLGDNRADSRDSRWFGDVPYGSVTSRVLLVYWPPDRARLVT